MITVDTNPAETTLYEALVQRAETGTVRRARLDIGDVCVCDGMCVVIERKSWRDFASSLVDGRYHEQKERMLHADTPRTRYCYAIEGGIVPWEGSTFAASNKQVWSAVLKTTFRDNIAVLHVSNGEHLAEVCLYILKQLASGGFDETAKLSRSLTKRKRDNLQDPTSLLRAMLCVIPGMSHDKAAAIVSQYASAPEIQACDEKSLAAIVVGKRAIGPVLAARIKSVFPQVSDSRTEPTIHRRTTPRPQTRGRQAPRVAWPCG